MDSYPPPPPKPQKPWYREWWVFVVLGFCVLVVVIMIGALIAALDDNDLGSVTGEQVGDSAADTSPASQPEEEPEPEPEPEPAPEEGTYGSDPALDHLYTRCEYGNMGACEDLFWESPLGSEYEAFALEQMEDGEVLAEDSGDPVLDELYDRCDGGDMQACDDLFVEAPLDSEYETFGDTCGGSQGAGTGAWCSDGTDGDDIEIGEEIHALAFELTWNEFSAQDQAGFCDGYETLGPEFAYSFFIDSYEGSPPSLDQFREFFDSKC